MSQLLTGVVVSINLETTAKGKNGEYPAWEIIYKNGYGEVKTLLKHINSMKYNKPLSNGLSDLAAGDAFTIEQDKNDMGYWEPKIAYKGIKEAASTPAPTKTAGNKPATSGGGNWPTSDERKATQTHIIRQSSLGHATALCIAMKKPDALEVIKVAKQFEAFVHRGDVTPALEEGRFDAAADEITF